jgi:flavin-dependent dehydrogenase
MEDRPYEVVVMGGGLAGLALAVQLKRRDPGIDILVAERAPHPPPVAAHKVGESTVEGGAWYYREALGLEPYLDAHQLPKSGLRWFFSDGSNTDIARRVEYGAKARLVVDSSQLDRGTLEAKLAEDASAAGVEFLDRCNVRDVTLGDSEHTVRLKRDGEETEVRARWVVDATGRFGLLKRKLDLAQTVHHKANSAWFRVPVKIDLNEWSSDEAWRTRLEPFRYDDGREESMRYLSTNHLTGPGYWLWFIPLAGEYTSVGIVVDDGMYPIGEINTLDKAMAWIEEHEPQAYSVVEPLRDEVMDFLFLRRYSHGCSRVYSPERWCITGVAGVFHDPLFSFGSDMIGVSNTFVTDLIARDHAGEDVSGRAELYNRIFLEKWADPVFSVFDDKYPIMGNPQVFSTYVHFTAIWYWAVNCSLLIHGKVTDLETLAILEEENERATKLLRVMEAFFVEWHAALGDDTGKADYFVPFCGHDWMERIHDDLNERPDTEEFVRNFRAKLANLEQFSTEIFWMAVNGLPDPPERRPIDPYAISLDRARWEADGLFDVSPEGTTAPDWKIGEPIDWEDELAELRGFDRLPDSRARAQAGVE